MNINRFGKILNNQSLKKLTVSNGLTIVGLVLTLVFGYWGVQLSKLSMKQSSEIVSQQQQIKGFDSL